MSNTRTIEVSILTSPLRLVLRALVSRKGLDKTSFNPHQPVKAGASLAIAHHCLAMQVSILTSPLRLVLRPSKAAMTPAEKVSILTSPLRLVLRYGMSPWTGIVPVSILTSPLRLVLPPVPRSTLNPITFQSSPAR